MFGTAYYTEDPGVDVELPVDWHELDSTGWYATPIRRPTVEPWHVDARVFQRDLADAARAQEQRAIAALLRAGMDVLSTDDVLFVETIVRTRAWLGPATIEGVGGTPVLFVAAFIRSPILRDALAQVLQAAMLGELPPERRALAD